MDGDEIMFEQVFNPTRPTICDGFLKKDIEMMKSAFDERITEHAGKCLIEVIASDTQLMRLHATEDLIKWLICSTLVSDAFYFGPPDQTQAFDVYRLKCDNPVMVAVAQKQRCRSIFLAAAAANNVAFLRACVHSMATRRQESEDPDHVTKLFTAKYLIDILDPIQWTRAALACNHLFAFNSDRNNLKDFTRTMGDDNPNIEDSVVNELFGSTELPDAQAKEGSKKRAIKEQQKGVDPAVLEAAKEGAENIDKKALAYGRMHQIHTRHESQTKNHMHVHMRMVSTTDRRGRISCAEAKCDARKRNLEMHVLRLRNLLSVMSRVSQSQRDSVMCRIKEATEKHAALDVQNMMFASDASVLSKPSAPEPLKRLKMTPLPPGMDPVTDHVFSVKVHTIDTVRNERAEIENERQVLHSSVVDKMLNVPDLSGVYGIKSFPSIPVWKSISQRFPDIVHTQAPFLEDDGVSCVRWYASHDIDAPLMKRGGDIFNPIFDIIHKEVDPENILLMPWREFEKLECVVRARRGTDLDERVRSTNFSKGLAGRKRRSVNNIHIVKKIVERDLACMRVTKCGACGGVDTVIHDNRSGDDVCTGCGLSVSNAVCDDGADNLVQFAGQFAPTTTCRRSTQQYSSFGNAQTQLDSLLGVQTRVIPQRAMDYLHFKRKQLCIAEECVTLEDVAAWFKECGENPRDARKAHCIITGMHVVSMTPWMKTVVLYMFKRYVTIWDKVRCLRINALSCEFIFHKICKYLGEEFYEFADRFPMFAREERQEEAEFHWALVCRTLMWYGEGDGYNKDVRGKEDNVRSEMSAYINTQHGADTDTIYTDCASERGDE